MGEEKVVPESLEYQLMQMIQAAAKYLGANMYHSNRLPVECLITDTCIGGVAEAAQTAENLRDRESASRSL